MNRRAFVSQGCACGALLLAGGAGSSATAGESSPSAKADQAQPINPHQVMAVLTDVDRSGDKALIDALFTRWGHQCFHSRRGLKAFALRQRANFQGYVDYVNSGRARYWERLDHDQAAGIIRVTSRKFRKCICAYAQCPQPAKALCTHCCKALQTALFKTMLGHKVSVRIDEAILLGGERCRTTVRIIERPDPEDTK